MPFCHWRQAHRLRLTTHETEGADPRWQNSSKSGETGHKRENRLVATTLTKNLETKLAAAREAADNDRVDHCGRHAVGASRTTRSR
jgi:hypothetical protein